MPSEPIERTTSISLTWTRHLEYNFRRFTKPVFLVISIGLAIIIGCPLIGAPFMMLSGLAALLYPLPIMLPRFSHLKIRQNSVVVCQVANPFAWWSAVALLLGAGMLLQAFVGGADSGRLVVPGAAAVLVGLPLSAYQAYRDRGPAILSGSSVSFRGPAPAFDLASASLSVKSTDSAPPSVTLYQSAPGQRESFTGSFPCLIYGLDFDTLYSTLEQLQSWSRAGQIATPQQIKAMLKVKPPKRLSVGESVEIPIQ